MRLKKLSAIVLIFALLLSFKQFAFADVGERGTIRAEGTLTTKSGYISFYLKLPEDKIDVVGMQFGYTLPKGVTATGDAVTSLKTKKGSWNIKTYTSKSEIMLYNDLNEVISVSNKQTDGRYLIAKLPVKLDSSVKPQKMSVTTTLAGNNYGVSRLDENAKYGISDAKDYFNETTAGDFIYKTSLSGAKISGLSTKTANSGAEIKQSSIKVTLNNTTLTSSDYSVSYKNNKKPGTATVVITGKGYYTGTASATFKILPQKVTGAKYTSTVNNIKVSWNKGYAVDGYVVYRSTVGSTKGYSLYKTLKGQSANSFTESNLVSNKKAYYRIYAYKTIKNKQEKSAYTAVSSRTTGYSVGKVSGLVATPRTNKSVKITWKNVSSDGYFVYRSATKNGTYKKVASVTGRYHTYYIDTALSSGKNYYYKIAAYKTYKNEKGRGEFSSAVYAATKPATVSGVKTTAQSGKKIKISWNGAAGAGGYEVYRATAKNGTYKKIATVSAKSYQDKGLTKGKTYYYKVKAYKKISGKKVYGGYSAVVSKKAK